MLICFKHFYFSYDYLRITDGRNRVIGTYCGQQTGRSVFVKDTVAVLFFHTDGSVEYDGFHLSFSFFPLGKPVYFSLLDDLYYLVSDFSPSSVQLLKHILSKFGARI